MREFKVGDRVEVRKDTPRGTVFIDETFPFMAKVVESRTPSLMVEAEESRAVWAVYPEMLTLISEEYTPRVGDKVRRTFKNGTSLQGRLQWIGDSHGEDELGIVLWTASAPDETELLERTIEFKPEPGTVYGHPILEGLRVVRVGPDDEFPWLGKKAFDEGGRGWFQEWEVERMVREEGWVEFDLEGNRVE